MKAYRFLLWFLAAALLCPVSGAWSAPEEPEELMTASRTRTFGNSQRARVEVSVMKDGRIHAEMILVDDSDLGALCAVAHFALEDRQGRVLEVHSLPQACVTEIQDFRAVRNTIHWQGEVASPDHLTAVSSMEIRIFLADSDPLFDADPASPERKAMFE